MRLPGSDGLFEKKKRAMTFYSFQSTKMISMMFRLFNETTD